MIVSISSLVLRGGPQCVSDPAVNPSDLGQLRRDTTGSGSAVEVAGWLAGRE